MGTTKEYIKDANDVFISRYVVRGCSEAQMNQLLSTGVMLPRNQASVIGGQSKKYEFGGRGPAGAITQEEREFLQQRDGSGDDQRLLSVTRNMTRKVLSSHGEVFTDEAVIVIDRSRVA